MKIGLLDVDATGYPNLALMKISSYCKSRGDDVAWFAPLEKYDQVYASKVFTYGNMETVSYLPVGAFIGGLGFSMNKLTDKIEHACPDYSLYPVNHSLGFTTRGCVKKCRHCFVPEKEGFIQAHADIDEFVRHRDVVLMDNNILAHEHGIKQIEKMALRGLKVDFNQGLDATLIDDAVARLLGKLKWLNPLRLACDSMANIPAIRKAVELLRWHNVTPRRYFCYVLVMNIAEAVEVVKFLKGIAVDPFAQPYRDRQGTEPTKEQSDFSRWVNQKAAFNSTTWENYT